MRLSVSLAPPPKPIENMHVESITRPIATWVGSKSGTDGVRHAPRVRQAWKCGPDLGVSGIVDDEAETDISTSNDCSRCRVAGHGLCFGQQKRKSD